MRSRYHRVTKEARWRQPEPDVDAFVESAGVLAGAGSGGGSSPTASDNGPPRPRTIMVDPANHALPKRMAPPLAGLHMAGDSNRGLEIEHTVSPLDSNAGREQGWDDYSGPSTI